MGARYAHRIGEEEIRVIHPKCGTAITILSLSANHNRFSAKGFCTRCGHYVHLIHEIEEGTKDE